MAQYSANPHIMRNNMEPYTLCGVWYVDLPTTSPTKVAKCRVCASLLAVALLVDKRHAISANAILTTK